MILHPGIMALLCGTTLVLLMMLYASSLAIKILRRWNFYSCSEEQLQLERKTFLVSTIVNYALGFQVLSLFLFIYTLEEIHPLFVGAMCATGSLNANPVGWSALYVKILVFFAAALWIALNYLDGRAEDSPLIKLKYSYLLLLTPLIGCELYLQISYFYQLDPEIITSCCGSLFSADGSGVAADLAGLAPGRMMLIFYALVGLLAGLAWLCWKKTAPWLRYGFSLAGAIFFVTSLISVISFISLYIYELPTHHCPFDLLQQNYGFIGYPLYVGLFVGTLFSILPGLFQPLKKYPSLTVEIERLEKKWLFTALIFFALFVLIASWPIVFGHFRLMNFARF